MYLLRPLGSEKGQGLTEYAVILALLVVVVIAVMILLGDQITAIFQTVLNAITV